MKEVIVAKCSRSIFALRVSILTENKVKRISPMAFSLSPAARSVAE